MKDKELKSLLTSLNATNDMGFKYPIGNKELTIKVRELESDGVIIYDPIYQKWNKRGNKISKRLQEQYKLGLDLILLPQL